MRRLHAAAGHLTEEAPEIIANPDAARGLEQALIGAHDRLPRQSGGARGQAAHGQHAIVMRRFRRVLEENPDQPLFIPEICKAIRVSERTLRACCHEHLRMSPKRYLLRRLQLARRMLRMAAAGEATVTEAATRCGFWQLGRFAVEYRSLFGETPSATLRRPPDQPAHHLPKLHSGQSGPSPKISGRDPMPDPGAGRMPSSGRSAMIRRIRA
ncbi:MAG: helix-turn-helix domain-containing protein [Stellaceae bacterium]